MSFFRLGLSSPFALDRFFRRNSGVGAGIIEVPIGISPTVVILFRGLPGLQFSRLLLPGPEPLLQISCMDAAIKNLGAQTDQTSRVGRRPCAAVWRGVGPISFASSPVKC